MHKIPIPITKTHQIRSIDIDADIKVSCFPSGQVEYALDLLRLTPGQLFKINVQAIFYRRKKTVGLSRQATFYSDNPVVEGVPPGERPYTGRTYPSDSAIYGVDDFDPTGGATRARHR